MNGILGIQREADRQALERDAMNMRGGMLRQDPGLMQRIGSAVADYAVPDRYLPSSVMSPRLDMSKLEALRGTPVDMADVPSPVPMLMDTMPMAGITAFHGSPHKFTKFDMSKIGTGEGAQAYGHGLYFAENPKVAKEYMRPEQNYQRATGHLNNRQEFVKDMMDQGRTKDDVWKMTQEKYGEFIDPSELSSDFKSIWAEPANLYKVDIPDEHIDKMLDWDKPLRDQPQSVKDFVKQRKQLPNLKKSYKDFGGAKMTGHEIHQWLKSGSGVGLDNPKSYGVAENQLLGGGVPGIKYLDQGSRQRGKGTSNFVMFDDQIPQILEINDKSIATGPLSKKKWYGGKDPTQLTENEFIKTHKTGTIPHGTYDKTDWWGTDIKTNPQLIKTIDTPQGQVEFRKSGIKNRYTKYIGDGSNREIARGDDGLALSLSDSEIKAKGYPVEDQTITAFLNGEPIGYASNEFGAVGVFLNPKGPRRFHGDSIGTELLTEFMKENPHMQMGQMTHSGERTARKTHKKLTNMMRGMLSGQ